MIIIDSETKRAQQSFHHVELLIAKIAHSIGGHHNSHYHYSCNRKSQSFQQPGWMGWADQKSRLAGGHSEISKVGWLAGQWLAWPNPFTRHKADNEIYELTCNYIYFIATSEYIDLSIRKPFSSVGIKKCYLIISDNQDGKSAQLVRFRLLIINSILTEVAEWIYQPCSPRNWWNSCSQSLCLTPIYRLSHPHISFFGLCRCQYCTEKAQIKRPSWVAIGTLGIRLRYKSFQIWRIKDVCRLERTLVKIVIIWTHAM